MNINRITDNEIMITPNFAKNTDHFSFYIRPTIGYAFNRSSLQPIYNNNSFNFNGEFGGDVELPWKINLHSDFNYQWEEKTEVLPVFNQVIWNASIKKSFLKDESLSIKLECKDILNQNNGFKRKVDDIGLTQNTYTTIRRFLMISAIWNFNKVGGK
ncbi:outer membrane beta-barrel protein [Arachidicoccus ginsenosidivorans]|uniref:Outer membrane beta-barrel protein n=1 Tax=Arachidicoccus ginsenosidivorans TaxID=496057 RepID=A0A5B8VLJ1_9BACT|nr:outer membrane beta-barrel protein [Arachidicoccus ginsenosidivorans]QEC72380.1 outer membrane beta-barrel protein [Arachidicoccus ginsenosidivorans]